jgi:hypothetical protein
MIHDLYAVSLLELVGPSPTHSTSDLVLLCIVFVRLLQPAAPFKVFIPACHPPAPTRG